MSIVIAQYLLYFIHIHSMLSAMQQMGYDLQLWYDYRLSFAIFFFRLISPSAI